MRAKFQLWLDESGQFEKEGLLKKKNYNPSLIGGVLVRYGAIPSADLSKLIDPARSHAMDLSNNDKAAYVVPLLERLKNQYGARQVFFENTDYENDSSNRQLYLRMMAEGLLQLMQRLNAEYESVDLDVTIAQRQDMTAPADRRRISEKEYIRALNRCMEKKKKEHRIRINEDSELSIRVRVAAREKRLQLADFVCNTRLTRNSDAFSGMEERIEYLYEDAYLFSLSEKSTSFNFILQNLTEGNLSDALLELFTTYDHLDGTEVLDLVISNIRKMDYRIRKIQIRKFISEMTAEVTIEDDYAVAEEFLNKINQSFIPILREEGIPFAEELHFHVLLRLTDICLRQGDLIRSAQFFEECRKVQNEMDDSLESVFLYYQLMEKGAYLAVGEYHPKKAVRMMKGAASTIEKLLNVIDQDVHLNQRFHETKSSYLGDALKAEVYAMLFMRHSMENWYQEVTGLIEKALVQYGEVDGESEKLYCYKSYVELCEGNIENAVRALFTAKSLQTETLDQTVFHNFLEFVCQTENLQDCREYLLYYLLIMEAAEKRQRPEAELMYQALLEQKTLMVLADLQKESDPSDGIEEIELDEIQEPDSGTAYYPAEVLNWKYASYLANSGKPIKALKYYERASDLCFAEESYTRQRIKGIAVLAERILCLHKLERESDARMLHLQMRLQINEIAELPLKLHSRSMIRNLHELINEVMDGDRIRVDILKSISEQIQLLGMLS